MLFKLQTMKTVWYIPFHVNNGAAISQHEYCYQLKKVKQLNQVQCNDLAEKQNYQSRDKATRDSTKRIETKFRGTMAGNQSYDSTQFR